MKAVTKNYVNQQCYHSTQRSVITVGIFFNQIYLKLTWQFLKVVRIFTPILTIWNHIASS